MDPPFTISVSSNSSGAVTFSVMSGPATISGYTVTLTGAAGPVVLQASQAASGIYAAGTQSASFSVLAGSVWLGNGNASLSTFDLTGAAITGSSGFTGTGIGAIASPLGLAFDSLGNAWVASSNGVSEFSGQGAALTPSGCTSPCTSGGITNPEAVAIDGSGQVWAANANGTVSVLSNAGAAVSPSSGYPGPGTAPAGIAIDISGNVWIPSATANTVTMILGGAAAPVAPLATGAVGIPTLSTSTNNLAFGNADLNTPTTQSLTLTSAGSAPVTISSAAIVGAGFAVSGATLPLTLNSGQEVMLTVQFDPTVTGAASGQITITSNSSTGGTATVALSGTGQTHEVDLSWDAPVTSPDPVAGYNVYRSGDGGNTYQLINSSVDTGTTYADTTVQGGLSYDYYVTSVDASGYESTPSNTISVTIP